MLFEMPADWVAMVPGVTHYQEPLGWSPRSSMPAFCAYVALQDLIMDEARFMTRAGGKRRLFAQELLDGLDSIQQTPCIAF